ncbi:M20 metallopeptidase family protein [Mediterraneibacter gnavus]|uniref:M20 metallopeptidase family protein n=1 Tax=Mediterraneibacter gnavus TaxID=33038 RepID=UPI00232D33E7|nr:M20/M25/M40 family metallo-hydrolase [Mediterraneibacter gnavus]MDB8709938.1 M20/M25/M40 family metallo-hydrolase [Mediterraneibacter gnavus]MDB8712894.1 M20/M25/M40 family metallo-hydrolase [Mediterraneibacter gnavus]
MYRKILEEAEALQKDLVTWRRQLHQVPEIGMDLPKTSQYVQQKLSEWKIPFERKANGSCVVGTLGTEGSCILLRGDMDALPICEESGEEFASENGCMHACGHDMHTTILLGAAKILKTHESELKGQVKLLFQPGEEPMVGAKTVIDEGILTEPEVGAAFAMHVTSLAPKGMILYGKHRFLLCMVLRSR